LKTKTSILLVEDDADDVYFISRALRSSGLEAIHVVNDGQAAVDFFIKSSEGGKNDDTISPCLVLLDLNLPLKSGLEVLQWVRQQPRWKNIIVIVLTSSTSESDMTQAYTLGANSYVIKPSDATKLSEFSQFLKGYWFGWNQLPPMCRSSGSVIV
jgi:CheY-like chemotaxis protein